ncbi:MAG TPA: ABC transporter permease [Hypericibacter adhaerens]|jgi:His/Glu/Gln/Arg/opine family amino acid ABC transporter permease subunit|uniref:Histidine/lysine/arginine/ornithine ABC transporter permease HisQ n=1 Tax=Hypericibacter adhaerens TaxID=2602016 RepID=A0A5J6N7W4_9PROT|nr:ABC transporter permease [Hypericibacter adhaerens]QEX24950.1 histidine/lysine/arginine/ornithine ABC transporter permease HisQ [Hypericibacter adhaerens]HWA42925.1 ABC transporter permease [Hypericibacter adhaerens]
MFDYKGYGHFLIEGAQMTIIVAVLSMALTTAMGLIGALGKLSRHGWARRLADLYTTIIRGVPELVLLLLIYYGGTVLLQHIATLFGREEPIDINAFVAGVLVIGFIYGAYATETFRGAFQAVPKGQIEAAMACGMNQKQIFWRIRLPQVWRFAIPGLGNVWLVLLKATSLMSVIGVEELTRKADLAKAPTREPFTFFISAAFIYLVFTAISDYGRHWAEKRANVGVRRA